MAGAEVYEVGDQVGLAVQFGTPDKPLDPKTVMISVRDPEGRMARLTFGSDAAVVRTAPGNYQVVIGASIAGRWQYRFTGSGRGIRAEHDGFFDVFDLTGEE